MLASDPATCPIIPGYETTISISKGRTGLGLSIVGGADTLLVGKNYFCNLYTISDNISNTKNNVPLKVMALILSYVDVRLQHETYIK